MIEKNKKILEKRTTSQDKMITFPHEWEMVSMGDKKIAEIRGNKNILNIKQVAFIPMELIPLNSLYVNYEIRFLEDIKSLTYCECGDLLLPKITPSLENGKQGIVPLNIPNKFAFATTEVYPIQCIGIDTFFCFYILKYPKIRNILINSMIGTTGRQRVPKEAVRKLMIPLPPLPEQKKIAEVLSTVDQAIEDVDRGIIKIEKIKKTLTFNLFTYGLRNKGTKTLKIGRIPKDWKISSLFEIAKVRYGLGQPPLKKEKGIPMIRATNIKKGKIFLKNLLFIDPRDIPDSRNPYLKENDIIVVRSGAYTGDVAYITQEWEGSVAGYDLIITPSENINPKYLSLFLLSNKIQKRYFGTLKERSAQPHLNSHQLEMTPIVYPSLVEQKKVAEIISATEQKKELLEKRKLRFLKLKKGLMNDLLTGQKRVRLES